MQKNMTALLFDQFCISCYTFVMGKALFPQVFLLLENEHK